MHLGNCRPARVGWKNLKDLPAGFLNFMGHYVSVCTILYCRQMLKSFRSISGVRFVLGATIIFWDASLSMRVDLDDAMFSQGSL